MIPVRLTLTNYRTFGKDNPISVTLGDRRVVAIVGPNNVGKSSLLKFIYEFRPLWQRLAQRPTLLEVLATRVVDVNPMGIQDASSVFCRRNRLPLAIRIDFPDSGMHAGESLPQLRSITFTAAERTRAGSARNALQFKVSFAAADMRRIRADRSDTRGLEWQDDTLCQREAPTLDVRDGDFTREADLTPLLDCANLMAVGRMLEGSRYFGASRHVLPHLGQGEGDAVIGADLVQRWNQWKNKGTVDEQLVVQEVTEQVRSLLGVHDLQINGVDNPCVFNVVVDKVPYALNEMGAGMSQLIAILVNVAIAGPQPTTLVLVDEPELNLHASLQASFVNYLAELCEGVIFATHSLGLARTTADEPIYSIVRSRGVSVLKSLRGMTSFAEFVGEMGFAGYDGLDFDGLLLVEGVNDVRTVMALLRVMKNKKRFLILPLGGAALICAGRKRELAVYKRIMAARRIGVVVDSEVLAKTAPLDADRRAFAKTCKSLGYRVICTKLRALENYFTDRAVKIAFGPTATALAPYEHSKSAPAHGWKKNEGYRIAKKMDEAELGRTDLGKFLRRL